MDVMGLTGRTEKTMREEQVLLLNLIFYLFNCDVSNLVVNSNTVARIIQHRINFSISVTSSRYAVELRSQMLKTKFEPLLLFLIPVSNSIRFVNRFGGKNLQTVGFRYFLPATQFRFTILTYM